MYFIDVAHDFWGCILLLWVATSIIDFKDYLSVCTYCFDNDNSLVHGCLFLGFEGHFKTVFQFQEADGKQIVNCLFQLCFALYAVVMLIGSIIDRVQTKRLLLAVVSWLFLVYTPLAYLIWNSEGVFAKMGVLDFQAEWSFIYLQDFLRIF